MSSSPTPILQLIDRLVSSSSPSDALESLRNIVESIQSAAGDLTHSNKDEDTSPPALAMIASLTENSEFMSAFCSILSENQISSRMTVLEGGSSIACEMLLAVLTVLAPSTSASTAVQRKRRMQLLKLFLSQPSEGRVIHSILDVIAPAIEGDESTAALMNHHPLYARISAIQALDQLTNALPTVVHAQILSAPNGIHRILQLLTQAPQITDEEEEVIRNQAILLCTTLVRTSPTCARLFIFSETLDKVLLGIAVPELHRYATHKNSNINPSALVLVGDCLTLCVEMIQRDTMGPHVFLGSKALLHALCAVLDLRLGLKYRFPAAPGKIKETDKRPNMRPSSTDTEDDLDVLLRDEGSRATTAHKNLKPNPKESNANAILTPIPYLTEEEATIVGLALSLLQTCITSGLEDDRDRSTSIRQERARLIFSTDDLLCRLLFDMALYALPPPNSPASFYVSAVPSPQVQCQALDILSNLLIGAEDALQDDILWMKHSVYFKLQVPVLDRLMFLICVGGGGGGGHKVTLVSLSQISMHALAVLRSCLNAPQASLMVLHTLAPPVDYDLPLNETTPTPPSVVQKLVNTLYESLSSWTIHSSHDEEEAQRLYINIIGAAGALGVFVTNGSGDTTREMLLRVPVPVLSPKPGVSVLQNVATPDDLMSCILLYLETFLSIQDSMESCLSTTEQYYYDMALTLLRFLAEWITSAPAVTAMFLHNPNSLILGRILQTTHSTANRWATVQAFAGLIFGLCMEYMSEEEIGGWSRSSIMSIIQKSMNVSKFTRLLEEEKTAIRSLQVKPWQKCPLEAQTLLEWYTHLVHIVRRRVIQELTPARTDPDLNPSSIHETKSMDDKVSLGDMVREQSNEIDSLRQKLSAVELLATQQSGEIIKWKRRAELNPSEFDELVQDLSRQVENLQQENSGIQSQLSLQIRTLQEQLNQQESRLHALSTDLSDAKNDLQDKDDENARLKDELWGLSSAYNTLESEYNNVVAKKSIDSTNSSDLTSTSDKLLKSQNAQLLKDLSAANEWIQLAVKKMDDLHCQNTLMSTELVTARNDKNGRTEQVSNMENQISELQMKVEQYKLECERLRIASQNTTVRSADPNDSTPENMLHLTHQGIEVQALHENDHQEKLLREEIRKLSVAYKAAQDWMTNAVKQYKTASKQLEDANLRNNQLLADMDSLRHQFSSRGDDGDNERFRLENEQLRTELINTKKDSQKYNELISQLEKRNADVEAERSELALTIDHLKEENWALQDSVQRIGLYNDERDEKCSLLFSEKELLHQQIASMTQQIHDNEVTLNERMKELQVVQEQNNQLRVDIEKSNRTIMEKRDQLATVEAKMSESEVDGFDLVHTINRLRNEKKDLEDSVLSIKSSNDDLHEKYSLLRSEKEELQRQIMDDDKKTRQNSENSEMLTKQNIDLRDDLERCHTTIVEMRDRLTEFQTWSEAAQFRIMELETAKQSAENELEASLRQFKQAELAKDGAINELLALKINYEEKIQLLSESAFSDKIKLESNPTDRTVSRVDFFEQERQTYREEIERLRSTNASLESDVSEAHQMLRTYEDKINCTKEEWANGRNALELKLQASNDEKNAMEAAVTELKEELIAVQAKSEEAVMQWKEYVEKLEESIRDLQTKMNDETSEASMAISQWEERCDELNKQVDFFEQERQTYREEIERLRSTNASLESDVSEVQQMLRTYEDKINCTKEEWANGRNALELKLQASNDEKNAMEAAVTELNEELIAVQAKSEEAVMQWKEYVEKLEESIRDLQTKMNDETSEASMAISQWEERCDELNKQVDFFEQERQTYREEIERLRSTNASLESDVSEVQQMLRTYEDRINCTKEEWANGRNALELKLQASNDEKNAMEAAVTELNEELIAVQAKSEEAVMQWKEYVEKLEESIRDLQTKMNDEISEASMAISQWEERCDELNKQVDFFEQERQTYREEIERLRSTNASLESDVSEVQQMLRTYEDKINCTKEEWSKDRHDMELQLRHLHERNHHLSNELNIVHHSTTNFVVLQKDYNEAKVEVLELKAIIGQLEDELLQTNNALRSHLTDEVSNRATTMATEALKSQLIDLRKQVTSDRNLLQLEVESRMIAEQEVEKLKADLSLLAQYYDDDEDISIKLRKMTSRAAENIVRRDQTEICHLRSNFSKVMEELAVCRENERSAENKLAQFQLQVNFLEQELDAVKQEALTSKQLSCDSLENETKIRQLLENRINRLTIDFEAASASYREEIDSLTVALSQVQSDRDRLSILLQDSEQANVTLVHAAINSTQTLEENTELEAFRIERSHYISKINQDASDMEKRIREAVAVNTATLQAQIYVEQGLRSTVEKQIDDLNKQLQSLKAERDVKSTVERSLDDSNQTEVHTLRLQLAHSMKELLTVQHENAELKQKLSTTETDALRKINQLIVECNQTEKALSEIQRKGKFDDVDENTSPNSMDICEILNYITNLKDTIHSERSYYEDVKIEQEELLALLARLNVMNESLQSTINDLVGEEALSKALLDAEHEVVCKFGIT